MSTLPSIPLHLTAAISLSPMPFSGSFSVFFLVFVISLSLLSHSFFHIAVFLFSVSSFFLFHLSHLYVIFLRFALTLSHDFLVSLYHLFLILIFFVSCISHLSHLFLIVLPHLSCLLYYCLILPFRSLPFFSLSHLFPVLSFSVLSHIGLMTTSYYFSSLL